EDGIRDATVTGVQTCALPILTQVGFAPTLYGGDYIGTWLSVYQTMFGGKLVDSSGKKITANCTACIAALQWEADLIKSIGATELDRKSTRLNSSHGSISYAVF